jgi:hypothetical protein
VVAAGAAGATGAAGAQAANKPVSMTRANTNAITFVVVFIDILHTSLVFLKWIEIVTLSFTFFFVQYQVLVFILSPALSPGWPSSAFGFAVFKNQRITQQPGLRLTAREAALFFHLTRRIPFGHPPADIGCCHPFGVT